MAKKKKKKKKKRKKKKKKKKKKKTHTHTQLGGGWQDRQKRREFAGTLDFCQAATSDSGRQQYAVCYSLHTCAGRSNESPPCVEFALTVATHVQQNVSLNMAMPFIFVYELHQNEKKKKRSNERRWQERRKERNAAA